MSKAVLFRELWTFFREIINLDPALNRLWEGQGSDAPNNYMLKYSGTYLDEDVWQEVQEYRKALVKLFR